MSKVDIIIPVYFSPELTIRCIESVLKNTSFSSYDIAFIIVEDSGKKSNEELLRVALQKLDPEKKIHLLIHPENKGFIEACYTGIQFRSSDYKILLNSDTFVMEGWLEEMVKTAESDPKIVMVNPATNHTEVIKVPMPAGSNVMEMHRYFRNVFTRTEDHIDLVTSTGFCILIRSQYINEYGFLDRIYGKGYCEETDLFFRYVTKGLRGVLARNAFVYHRGEASFNDRGERFEKNKKILLERYESVYKKMIKPFLKRTIINRYRKEQRHKKDLATQVLFFSPTNRLTFEKVTPLHALCNALNENEISASMVCTTIEPASHIDDRMYMPLALERLYEFLWQPKVLAFAHHSSVTIVADYAKYLKEKYNYLPQIVYVQEKESDVAAIAFHKLTVTNPASLDTVIKNPESSAEQVWNVSSRKMYPQYAGFFKKIMTLPVDETYFYQHASALSGKGWKPAGIFTRLRHKSIDTYFEIYAKMILVHKVRNKLLHYRKKLLKK